MPPKPYTFILTFLTTSILRLSHTHGDVTDNTNSTSSSSPHVDFLVTSDYTNISNTNQHFIARITDPVIVEEAREEVNKTSSFKIISGIIEKSPASWNPGWSFHLIPETVFFGDFFVEVCDATVEYVEENLDEAGGSFLPNLQWCPWGTRVLEEIVYTPPPHVDFLVTSDYNNISNTNQHFIARITDPVIVEEAREEVNKTSSFKIISGTIEKSPASWNPGWSFHLIPETVFFGDFFVEVCDATVEYVEEHLDEAGGSFLPNLQWCPWGTRVLKEIKDANNSNNNTMSTMEGMDLTSDVTRKISSHVTVYVSLVSLLAYLNMY